MNLSINLNKHYNFETKRKKTLGISLIFNENYQINKLN